MMLMICICFLSQLNMNSTEFGVSFRNKLTFALLLVTVQISIFSESLYHTTYNKSDFDLIFIWIFKGHEKSHTKVKPLFL